MATVQDRKAPSAGTKVDPGREAPTTKEGAGAVAADSLAAESVREGGKFSENRHAEPDTASNPAAGPTSSHSSTAKTDASVSGASALSGNAATAPSYVNNQYIRDTTGPHGKNLKEGGFYDARLKDGLQEALKVEPGSINDPSRLAEQKFDQEDAATAADSGPRESKLKTGTAYDKLNSETSS